MKAVSTKMKELNKFIIRPKEDLETFNHPEFVLSLQKDVKYEKK